MVTPRSAVTTRREAPAAALDGRSQSYTATLSFSPSHGRSGDRVELSGDGYPAGAAVDLVWYTVDASYELEGGTEFLGQRFEERSWVLTTTRADAAGRVAATIEIPSDFGGAHDVRGRVDGRELSQAALTVDTSVTVTPTEGPLGTPIEVRVTGIDWRPSTSTWHVLYDNKYFGFVSAVTTRGVATARFRAAGPLGDRVIGVWRNSYNSAPYLAAGSPLGGTSATAGPGTELIFRVTEDPGAAPGYVEDFAATDDPWPIFTTGPASISVYPDRGLAGQRFELHGVKLPPDADLTVRWWTTVGNRITNVGMVEEAGERRRVRTDGRGTFRIDMQIPDDLGGQHKIDLIDDDEKVLGSTGFVVLPQLVSIGPTKLRVGEKVTVHLKGLGWTTYDNTYTVTYDNAYIGYVCGFSTVGDIRFTIAAAGTPGTHLLDLYPTIYKAKDPSRMPRAVYSVPQLTYAEDHPQRRTPAVRLAIEIVA
jgi:hypothetical protein